MNRINLIAILAIAIVVSIPIAYSAVEPSIIINMLTGQTTSPITIKNSTGATIFQVDQDACVNGVCKFHMVIDAERTHDMSTQTCTVGCGFEDYSLELARIEVEFDNDNECDGGIGTCFDYSSVWMDGLAMRGQLHSSAGSGTFVNIRWLESIDGGVTVSTVSSSIGNSATTYNNFQEHDFHTNYFEMCEQRPTNKLAGFPDCIITLMGGNQEIANGTLFYRNFEVNTAFLFPNDATFTITHSGDLNP